MILKDRTQNGEIHFVDIVPVFLKGIEFLKRRSTLEIEANLSTFRLPTGFIVRSRFSNLPSSNKMTI